MNKKDTQTGSQNAAYAAEPRVYELGYIVNPNMSEGNLAKEREALVALITKYKGIVISEGQPQLIDLAYEMSRVINNKRQKYNQGYFGWIKFDTTPDLIDALTEEVDAMTSLVRFLVIKTVRENILTSDTPFKLAKGNASNQDDDDEEFGAFDIEGEEDEDFIAPELGLDVEADLSIEDAGNDDLEKIEGIGPKIAEVLKENGITSFATLSASKIGDLRTILADNDLAQHDPKSWSKQATLAKNAKWDELDALQSELKGGRE